MSGFNIPTGSLDNWLAALAASASQRVEVVVLGDSTTADSGADYSWVYELARLANVAGFTYGGRGVVEDGDTATRSGPLENLNSIQSKTGFGTLGPVDLVGGTASDTAGDSFVWQGRGTTLRLYYAIHFFMGSFKWRVDGGAWTEVSAHVGNAVGVIYVSGLSYGLHTVEVQNVGGFLFASPVINGGGPGSNEGVWTEAGPHYYVVTGVNSTGETLPTSQFEIDHQSFNSCNVTMNSSGFVSYNLYRSTSPSGPFYFLSNTLETPTYTFLTQDNGDVPLDTGRTPPLTSSAGYDTSQTRCSISAEFMNSVGLVFHKNAVSGAAFNTYGLESTYNGFPYQLALGITQVDSGWSPAARPNWRTPTLAICALGINNQQASNDGTKAAAITACQNGTQKFIEAARAGGAQPLVVLPHFKRSFNSSYAPDFKAAIQGVADDNGVPWIDFDFALDAASYMGGGPHLDQTGYNIEAAYVWSVIGAAVTPPTSNPALLGAGFF